MTNPAIIPGPPSVGGMELIILLVFGARRIPELARSLGSGVHEFRGGISGVVEREKAGNGNQG